MKRRPIIVLALCLMLAAGAWLWFNPPGRFGYHRFGLTVYSAIPFPGVDVVVYANGLPGIRASKAHWVSSEEFDRLIGPQPDAWPDVVVIGTWQPDEDFPPIFKGQVLLIPDLLEELEYIVPDVERDDITGTLSWAVTLHYGEQYGSEMVIDALCAYNELSSCISLHPGQTLRIPRLRNLLPDMAHILEPDYHFIRPRDTLEGIALAYYGLPGEWIDIHEVPENEELIGENLLDLPVGVLLFLPELPLTTPHVVEPGDTLSSIADQVCYGDPGRWPHIQFVNRKVLGDDVEQLRPGQRLTLYGCDP